MSNCSDNTQDVSTVAASLQALGPRTVEGDQGRVSMYGLDEAIRAIEYDRTRNKMKNKASVRAVLRTISGHRLSTHDGPAS